MRFRDGRSPLDLPVIDTGARYPVNLYAGFFRGSGTEESWPPAEVTAIDAEGRPITSCTLDTPGDSPSHCAGT